MHGRMETDHEGMERMDPIMMMIWEKMDEENKKKIMERMLDEKIMMKENLIAYLEHKTETMKMIKTMMEEI
jgi:predicted Fe-S protein YdhL (DUF1289 family)